MLIIPGIIPRMRTRFILLLTVVSCSVFGQDYPNLDHLMTRRVVRCPDIDLNSKTLIPRYYREGKTDSVVMVLQYWNAMCARTEPQWRMTILMSLHDGTFSQLNPQEVFDALIAYQAYLKPYVSPPFFYRYYYRFEYPGPEPLTAAGNAFDLFTKNLAFELQSRYQPGTLEYFVCLFYQDEFEPLYNALNTTEADTEMAASYREQVELANTVPGGHLAMFTGVWAPRGRLASMGEHPVIGVTFGWFKKRWGTDLTTAFAFLKARNPYTLTDDDGNAYTSQRFKEFYFAVEPYYVLAHSNKLPSLFVTTGIGYESITMYSEKVEDDQPGVYVGTFSTTAGLGYRHFFNEERGPYLGIQLRYHFLNFKPRGGTNLDGDAVSIRLFLGGITRDRQVALKRLYSADR